MKGESLLKKLMLYGKNIRVDVADKSSNKPQKIVLTIEDGIVSGFVTEDNPIEAKVEITLFCGLEIFETKDDET